MTAIPALECGACKAAALPPALACFRCGSRDLRPIEMPGRGSIHATTTIRVPIPDPDDPGAGMNPVAVIRLESGVLLLARLDRSLAETRPAIGTPVALEDRRGAWFAVPVGTDASSEPVS